MKVSLVHVTPEAEKHIAYCARVSNPNNQDNPEYAKLLKFCIKHSHWSVFEMANLCLEIQTSRAIAAQILRHKSFVFQEFSQRYQAVTEFETYPARRQDVKNRQNSIDDMSQNDKDWFEIAQKRVQDISFELYQDGLARGIAKEQMRFLLPLSTKTTMYMNGSVRSWIHYILVRTDPSTQLEHRLIAEECKKIFKEQFPIISEALEW